MHGHLLSRAAAAVLAGLFALGPAGCSGGPTDLVPAAGALAPLAGAPADETREYPNINVAPGQPEGEPLNPEQQTALEGDLRGRGEAAEAEASDPGSMDAAARELAAERAEAERRREADRALLCDRRNGGDVPPSCEQ